MPQEGLCCLVMSASPSKKGLLFFCKSIEESWHALFRFQYKRRAKTNHTLHLYINNSCRKAATSKRENEIVLISRIYFSCNVIWNLKRISSHAESICVSNRWIAGKMPIIVFGKLLHLTKTFEKLMKLVKKSVRIINYGRILSNAFFFVSDFAPLDIIKNDYCKILPSSCQSLLRKKIDWRIVNSTATAILFDMLVIFAIGIFQKVSDGLMYRKKSS